MEKVCPGSETYCCDITIKDQEISDDVLIGKWQRISFVPLVSHISPSGDSYLTNYNEIVQLSKLVSNLHSAQYYHCNISLANILVVEYTNIAYLTHVQRMR